MKNLVKIFDTRCKLYKWTNQKRGTVKFPPNHFIRQQRRKCLTRPVKVKLGTGSETGILTDWAFQGSCKQGSTHRPEAVLIR